MNEGVAVRRLIISSFLLCSALSFGQSKTAIVDIQRDIAQLTDELRTMRTGQDAKFGELTSLLQRAIENQTRITERLTGLEKGLAAQERSMAAPVATLGQKLDTMSSEFQYLRENVNEVGLQMKKVQTQLVDMNTAIKIMQAPPAAPAPAPGTPAGGPPAGVTAEKLYQDAKASLSGGQLEFAAQQFNDFLRFFGESDLAPNAQYYIGEIAYQQGRTEDAIRAFDTALEKYPDNSKTLDAMYMKGLAYLKAAQRTQAAAEFRAVNKRSPYSEQASKARDQLKKLGLPAAAPATGPAKRKR